MSQFDAPAGYIVSDSTSAASAGIRHKKSWIKQIFAAGLVITLNIVVMPLFVYMTGIEIVKHCGNIMGIFLVACCLLTWLLTMGAVLITAISDPGYLPRSTLAAEQYFREKCVFSKVPVAKVSIKFENTLVIAKWCHTCHFYRPVKCSHCSLCDRCIEVYDHHCPYLGNCIGRRNHKYFFILLVNMLIEMITFVVAAILVMSHTPRTEHWKKEFVTCVSLLVLCGVCGLPLVNLLIMHTSLISTGQTTRDLFKFVFVDNVPMAKNPFDKGLRTNWYNFIFSPQRPSILDHLPTTAERAFSRVRDSAASASASGCNRSIRIL